MLVIYLFVYLFTYLDRMKPVIIAKLAHQCSDLYADAMKMLQLESIKGLWPKVRGHVIECGVLVLELSIMLNVIPNCKAYNII